MNSPSVIKAIPNYVNGEKVLKRVVGYARVSTEEEKQDSSFNLQIKQLEKDIRSNPDYQFLGVFKDKGSGRTSKRRDEFNLMIELAKAKSIDLIITKSISRFARNLVDTLSFVRELRNIGVDILFQKENISTLDDSFDLLLSMLSAHAEEESKNISDNNNWSIKRRKQNGDNFTSKLYGYHIKKNKYTINENEAKVVRDIFDLYIRGCTYKNIIFYLYEQNVKSPTGNDYWARTTLEKILTNEKYCGDMILGKHSLYIETQELTLVKYNHAGIITRKVFDLAIKIRSERRKIHPGYRGNSKSPYTGWLYSTTNERHLRYKLEKPKGHSGKIKSQIPTLCCYGNQVGSKRVSFQVKVIIDLLDQIIGEFKAQFLIDTKSLADAKTTRNDLYIHDVLPLVERHNVEKKTLKLREIRKTLISSKNFQIEDYRNVFHKIIVNDHEIAIKISLLEDKNISLDHYHLVHQTNFTYLKLYKPITLPVSVYLENLN